MLGVERGKVTLSAHDDDWAEQFCITKQELMTCLGENIMDIRHVGSTAINGITAKPILDVAVVVKDLHEAITTMKANGYDFVDEGNPGRYLFVRRCDGNISTHHIHCYCENHDNFKDTVLFCEFLNKHREYAKQYSDLKGSTCGRSPGRPQSIFRWKSGIYKHDTIISENDN